MTSLFGRHWQLAILLAAVMVISGGLFAYRWLKRGVFKGLKETTQTN
jgi:hypothetical protein